jgi:hypothetical protein
MGLNRELSRGMGHVRQAAKRRVSNGINLQLCFEFTLEVILPIAGIALEIFNSKFAKLVNVGCFVVAGCFWLVAAVWDHSDPFFGVLLILAIALLIVAGLSSFVYRTTRSDAYEAKSR